MISATDLIDPDGDILPSMFPKDDTPAKLEARVDKYLERARAIVEARGVVDDDDADAAMAAYVYYLANSAVYTDLSAQPTVLNFTDAGSRTRTQAQIESFNAKALAYLAEFEVLAPLGTTIVATRRHGSTSLPTLFTW
jgi:hypothetical protein